MSCRPRAESRLSDRAGASGKDVERPGGERPGTPGAPPASKPIGVLDGEGLLDPDLRCRLQHRAVGCRWGRPTRLRRLVHVAADSPERTSPEEHRELLEQDFAVRRPTTWPGSLKRPAKPVMSTCTPASSAVSLTAASTAFSPTSTRPPGSSQHSAVAAADQEQLAAELPAATKKDGTIDGCRRCPRGVEEDLPRDRCSVQGGHRHRSLGSRGGRLDDHFPPRRHPPPGEGAPRRRFRQAGVASAAEPRGRPLRTARCRRGSGRRRQAAAERVAHRAADRRPRAGPCPTASAGWPAGPRAGRAATPRTPGHERDGDRQPDRVADEPGWMIDWTTKLSTQ